MVKRETPMRTIRFLGSGAALVPGRALAAVLDAPHAVAAVLDAPRAAKNDPTSRQLRRLLADGFVVSDFDLRRDPVWTQVVLRRGDETRELKAPGLAFAAFAVQVAPRVVAGGIGRDRGRTLRLATRADEREMTTGTLGLRAQTSTWIAGQPGLAAAVAAWENDLGVERATRADQIGRAHV